VNWQAIATRAPKLLRATHKKFDDLFTQLDKAKARATLEANLKQLEECRQSGKTYSDSITTYFVKWFEREELGKRQNIAANEMLVVVKDTATLGLQETVKSSTASTATASTAALTLIIGAIVFLVISVMLSYAIASSGRGDTRTNADAA